MTALLVVMALGGVAVIAWGCFARTAPAERSCASCRYLLRTINGDHHCPECGIDLWQGDAIQVVRRTAEPRLIWAGAFVCAGTALLAFHEQLGPSLANWWLQARPNTWVRQQVLSNNAAARQAAMTELASRTESKRLSAADWTALISDLCGLAQREPQTIQWPQMLELLMTAKASGQITQVQLEAVARSLFGPVTIGAARSRIRQGSAVEYEVRLPPGAPGDSLQRSARIERVRDAQLNWPLSHTQNQTSRGSPTWSIAGVIEVESPPGRQAVLVDVAAELIATNDAGARTTIRWSIPLRIDLQVLADDEPAVALVSNPDLTPAIQGCVRVRSARLQPASDRPEWVQQFDAVVELCDHPPAPLSFEVTVRAGEWMQFIGLVSSNGQSPQILTAFVERFPQGIDEVDFLFRPHQRWAQRTLDTDEAWGDEVNIIGVALGGADEQTPAPSDPPG